VLKPKLPVEICLRLWEDKPCQKFIIPANELESIDCWVHEFTELGIRNTFFKIQGGSYTIPFIMPSGEIQQFWFEHILTSLIHPSIINNINAEKVLIQPDEFTKFFLVSIKKILKTKLIDALTSVG
jgi:hypothetical protein